MQVVPQIYMSFLTNRCLSDEYPKILRLLLCCCMDHLIQLLNGKFGWQFTTNTKGTCSYCTSTITKSFTTVYHVPRSDNGNGNILNNAYCLINVSETHLWNGSAEMLSTFATQFTLIKNTSVPLRVPCLDFNYIRVQRIMWLWSFYSMYSLWVPLPKVILILMDIQGQCAHLKPFNAEATFIQSTKMQRLLKTI